MRRIATGIGCLIVVLLITCPVQAQIGNEGPSSPIELVRPPARDLDPVNPIPRPIAPAVAFESDEMQLVGFTRLLVAGNEGVLNMSIACQREFRGSRVCTLEEVHKTRNIPEALGGGFAWLQNIAGPNSTPELNCRGWMSDSVDDHGTSIELGECYGGVGATTCDVRLAVACCAATDSTRVR